MDDNRICSIKERTLSLLEMGLTQDIANIDAKELGELMDIVKDCCETIKYDEETKYYKKVVEAMEENASAEKLGEYLPETEGKYYTRLRDAHGKYMYSKMPDDRYDNMYLNRMYYTPMYDNTKIGNTDYRNGKAYISRRGYMEANEKGDIDTASKELEKYFKDLGIDITEMISNMSTSDKQIVKRKIEQLAEMM